MKYIYIYSISESKMVIPLSQLLVQTDNDVLICTTHVLCFVLISSFFC